MAMIDAGTVHRILVQHVYCGRYLTRATIGRFVTPIVRHCSEGGAAEQQQYQI